MAKPPYKLIHSNGSINVKNPTLILPSTNNLIDIATREIQGEKHSNFFIGLGSAAKISRSIVENAKGRIALSRIVSNSAFFINNI
ncbi:MAG: hypothetical protein AAGA80_02070 [Cyanobacteria bacterium P01_F01_bin.143]